ncbi:MAG: serine hydrolase [Bacteroidota bacterium]|nr:serine hydrolase [Bacteroidota bacterium]MDP4212021.1 serine hydrolase [Bacteroidota bacterium]MDP4249957.1 serine hydrolase [Bacteroidota bacterium]
MRILILLLSVFTFLGLFAPAQMRTDSFLKRVLESGKDSLMQQVLRQKEKYRIQIIYTRIDRDAFNKPSFRNFYFNTGDSLYYYPASTVKLPLALLSLEKLNRMKVPGVNKYTTLQYDSSWSGQKALYRDSTAQTGLPSIAQFIRKAFLISDNDAYNRMYEFVGQQEINRSLHAKGYRLMRIVRQFMRLSEEENRHTNQIRFLSASGKTIFTELAAFNRDSFDFSRPALLGKGYLNWKDSMVNEPMNFTRHNNIPLVDLQQILQSVLFPLSVPEKQRFRLSRDDYAFLYRYLSQYPSETPYPKYDTALFNDSYAKFYFAYGGRRLPDYIRVFNKVGWAYGCLTDVSYVADFRHQTEFMLTATIYANEDEILNDDKYEFETVGFPFFYQLGQTIYKYDLYRKRKYSPDLKAFKLTYEHRDAKDDRPSIKNVDN